MDFTIRRTPALNRPSDIRTSIAIERLIAAEELARDAWVEIAAAKSRDGTDHPELRRLAESAWKAWGRLQAERQAQERRAP